MSLRLWTFASTGFHGLVRIAESRYQRFRRGDAPLPGDSTEIGYVMELLMEIERRRPVRIVHCAFVRYALTNDGRRSPADVTSQTHATVGIISGLVPDLSSPSNVYSIMPRLSRERLRTGHSWKPSDEALQALCEYINSRSGKTIVRPDFGRPTTNV